MFHSLQSYCEQLSSTFNAISEERKVVLGELADYIARKSFTNESANLVFVCTHNSRRSILGQAWSIAAARHYGFTRMHAYSGGTEVSAVYPQIIAELRHAGFEVRIKPSGKEQIYFLRPGEDEAEVPIFSKKFDYKDNPLKGFAAIMTCSDADEKCPFIPGAEIRLAIRYDDPKHSDGAILEGPVYRERSEQIGREMLFVFSRIVA